ncbi:MAG: hypothetical protein EBS54_04975 [Betaproteobacteria bacterium]|nr:hypothetical protein [Betaproteobacteria bacterium]
MNKLHKYLDEASKAYYQGNPIINDLVFDILADSCGYNKVGAQIHGRKAKHAYQMYSLQKWYSDEGRENPLKDEQVTTSIKLDGAAISLLYLHGNLAMAITRG